MRELISFPFKPHLVRFLWQLCRNEVIETNEARYKHLDIDLRTPTGTFIRSLVTKTNFPKVPEPSKGFRFTIRIPKRCKNHSDFIEDGRHSGLIIDEKTADLIQQHFETMFREHFVSFVMGAIIGSGQSRQSKKNAIVFFMDTYELHDVYTYEQLVKVYDRTNSPLKKSIYAK